jgi:hypothetical protein
MWRICAEGVCDGVGCFRDDRLTGARVVKDGGVGVEDFEVVGCFGECADGAARGADVVDLFQCDCGEDAFDGIRLGLSMRARNWRV